MTDKSSWMPSDEDLGVSYWGREHARRLIASAVEKALAEQREILTAAFEKQLRETDKRHRRDVLNAQVSSLVRIIALRAELAALEGGKP